MHSWGSRVWRSLTTGFVCVALIAQLVYVPPARAVQPQQKPSPHELADKRTVSSRTYDNGDGTYTYESYAQPVNYFDQEEGGWKHIDSSLEATMSPSGSGFKNRANAFSVFLPDRISQQAVSISSGSDGVFMRPIGRPEELDVNPAYAETSTAVTLQPNARRYAQAFGNSDLIYLSSSRGLKETIVVQKQSSKNVYSFDLDCAGVEPSLDSTGGVVLTSLSTGKVVFHIVAPYMTDSSSNELGDPDRSDKVHYALKRVGSSWRLDVVADKDWLTDPARVYPIKIDPTTYFTGTAGGYDTYVSSTHPTVNYGLSTQVQVGRVDSLGTGITRAYVKPDISGLIGQGLTVLDAKLNLYCYYRYQPSTSAEINCSYATAGWGEDSLTWDNQPGSSFTSSAVVKQGATATWDVTHWVQNYVLGLNTEYGFRLSAPYEGTDLSYYSKFYAAESGDSRYPALTVKYTTEPQVTLLTPSAQVPVSSSSQSVRTHWRFSDALGKKQAKVQVQIASAPDAATIIKDTGEVDTTQTVLDVSAPSGGWSNNRLWIRMRAWGTTTELLNTFAPSDWTTWQSFDRKTLTSSNDGAGLLPYRSTDAVGAGGLAVDLPSGKLIGSRSDSGFAGLGGAITYGATYDSSRTADEGLGCGWRMAMPSLATPDQKALNPSFDDLPLNGQQPAGWTASTTDSSQLYASTGKRRTGTYALRFYYSGTGYANLWAATAASAGKALRVQPGEQLAASAWAYTLSMGADTSQIERGALLKIHFYDANGALIDSSKSLISEGLTCANTSSWTKINLQGKVPAGAYYARLNLEMRNARGTIWFDDVELHDASLHFVDGTGTSRALNQVGDGVYSRDPLDPSVAFERVNLAKGASGVSSAGTSLSEATDGIVNNTAALSNYDSVAWKSDGSAYLQYDLGAEQVLSQVDLYLWDGEETAPRSYQYRIDVSADGTTWSHADPSDGSAITGRSWISNTFTPIRARYIRVVALNNTANSVFHLCEIRVPQLRLGDTVVCANASGQLQATGDLSGNFVRYGYDVNGRLVNCDDAGLSSGLRRGIDLDWVDGMLSSVDWHGVSSGGSSSQESGVVTLHDDVDTGSGEYSIVRSDDTADVAVATYEYDDEHRICGIVDADGVGYTIAYDAQGRVSAVTSTGDTTPTVTAYQYASDKTTITTTGGSDAEPTQEVSYDCANGCQVTSIKTIDPDGADPVTSVSYDEYGQPWKTTDPLGRITVTETDGRGNVVRQIDENSAGATLRQTGADYSDGHLTQATDVKGNVSTYGYDDAWRLLTASDVVSDEASAGASVSRQTYDEWGNLSTSAAAVSSSYNLLRNGTFALDPSVVGNGWDGPDNGTWSIEQCDEKYHGNRILVLSDYNKSPFITSDEIGIKPDMAYALSASMEYWGDVNVLEYSAAHVLLNTQYVLRDASTGTGTDGDFAMRRISSVYRPSSDSVKYVRIRLTRPQDGELAIDNVRFEQANSASADSFVENESMERVTSSGLPQAWARRSTVYTTAVHDASSDSCASGMYSAHIGQSTSSEMGYFFSDKVTVVPGELYTSSVWMKTKSSVGGAKAIIRYSDASGAPLVSLDQTISGGLVKGTVDWKRYTTQLTVPSGAASLQIGLYHEAGGGDAYWDAASLNPGNGVLTTEYDSASHTYAVKHTDTTGVSVDQSYDGRGRATETNVTPAGATSAIRMSSQSYDGLDRLKSVETLPGSGLGITTTYGYTAAGRLKSIVDPLSHKTSLVYDSSGNLSSIADPLGIVTANAYDSLGRLRSVSIPSVGAQSATSAVTYGYDTLGRLKSTAYMNPNGTEFARSTTSYDVGSRATAQTFTGDVTGSIANTYDDLDRITARTSQGPAGTFKTDVAYDVANNPTKGTYTAFGTSWDIGCSYAKTNELATMSALGTTWTFGFANGGLLTSAWSLNALHTRSYDEYGRLQAVRTGRRSTPGSFTEFVESSLGYDARSRVTSQKLVGDIRLTDTFSFDDADRLTGWQRTGDGATGATYAYDAAGNMTKAIRASSETDYSYDADNRLTKASEGSKVATYTNDVYGRRTSATASGETTTYAYNPLGQLTGIDSSSTSVAYAYGPSGMRELKTVVSDGATSTVRSVWDGQQLVAEQDGDGTTYAYVWGPDRVPLALKVTRPDGSSSTYSYHLDALGDVIGLTSDAGQTVVATYSYDPWGALTAIGGTDPALAARQPLRYRSYYYDAESGLYRLPARTYDPATARFLTPDPAAPSASDPLGLNRYSYCEDSPIAAADPSGATMDANGDGKIGSEDSIAESYEHATPRLKAYWWSSLHAAMKAAHKRDAIIEKAKQAALRKIKLALAARARARGFHNFATAANGVLGCAVPILFGLAASASLPVLGAVAVGLTIATLGIGITEAVKDYEGGASWGQAALDIAGTAVTVAGEVTGASVVGRLIGEGAAAAAGALVPWAGVPVDVADYYVN